MNPVAPVVVVNDASCLIDLRKAGLLHLLIKLPYRFVLPYPVRYSELLDFSVQEWAILDSGGMQTIDLPSELVAAVLALKSQHSRLSANDCFCLVTAQQFEGSVLLTGDNLLRRVATAANRRVHGVLWVVDQILEHGISEEPALLSALRLWEADPSVFLPRAEITRRISQLAGES